MQLLEKIAGGNCELKLLQKNCWNQGKPKCKLAISSACCSCADPKERISGSVHSVCQF
mgnify:CR=1 FL=1